MYGPTTCAASHNAISSPASADGPLPCDSLGGLTLAQFGQALAPANLSASQAEALGLLTSGIYGRHGSTLSLSVPPPSSWVSKLMRRLGTAGSTLFRLTWKESATPSGRSVSLLRASAHRISDSACGSWPTPNAEPQNDGGSTWEARRERLKAEHKNGNGFGLNLGQATQLAAWPTPRSAEAEHAGRTAAGTNHTGQTGLAECASLASWATPRANDSEKRGELAPDARNGLPMQAQGASPKVTPSARDWKDSPGMATERADGRSRLDQLPRQVGALVIGSPAETGKPGQLNPAHSRWLMGYPAEWDACAPTATPLSRKSRPK
jgi:hypothetical protein